MAEETQESNDDLEFTVGPNDMMVLVQKGEEYHPSDRVASALEELAQALAAEETSEVSGYSFSGGMALESGFAGNDPMALGCIRVGCLRGGGGGTTVGNCDTIHTVVKCRGGYTASKFQTL